MKIIVNQIMAITVCCGAGRGTTTFATTSGVPPATTAGRAAATTTSGFVLPGLNYPLLLFPFTPYSCEARSNFLEQGDHVAVVWSEPIVLAFQEKTAPRMPQKICFITLWFSVLFSVLLRVKRLIIAMEIYAFFDLLDS